MPRNGSGNYSIPNVFTPNTLISSSAVNVNFGDLSAAMTDSLARDGQGGMTGPFRASAGSMVVPSISFGADTDCGWWRKGANNIGFSLGGTEIIDFAQTAVSYTVPVNATKVRQGGFDLVPAGTVLPYAGSTAPNGYLFCFGQAVSRTTYADLFAAIGTTYGGGDGSTTFNLPDLRGRVIAGKDNMGGTSADRLTGITGSVNGDVLGAAGGHESIVLTSAQSGQKAINSAPVSIADPGHFHSFSLSITSTPGGGGPAYAAGGVGNTTTNTTGIAASFTLAGSDASAAHPNVQPTIVLQYIIKT